MSTLLDSDNPDIRWLPPVSPLRGEVDLTCSSEASKREVSAVSHFPGRARGLGTLDGQPLRETIGGEAAVRAGRCFGLSADVSDWPLRFPFTLEFLKPPLGPRWCMQRFRGKMRGIHTSACCNGRATCSHYILGRQRLLRLEPETDRKVQHTHPAPITHAS